MSVSALSANADRTIRSKNALPSGVCG
jgi:hypothetical protein